MKVYTPPPNSDSLPRQISKPIEFKITEEPFADIKNVYIGGSNPIGSDTWIGDNKYSLTENPHIGPDAPDYREKIKKRWKFQEKFKIPKFIKNIFSKIYKIKKVLLK